MYFFFCVFFSELQNNRRIEHLEGCFFLNVSFELKFEILSFPCYHEYTWSIFGWRRRVFAAAELQCGVGISSAFYKRKTVDLLRTRSEIIDEITRRCLYYLFSRFVNCLANLLTVWCSEKELKCWKVNTQEKETRIYSEMDTWYWHFPLHL